MEATEAVKLCPCGSQLPFSSCCEPYLLGLAVAPTAEALMRSRYAAFSTGNVDYILATQKRLDRHGDRPSLQKSVNSTQWTNLIVVSTRKGKAKDKTGIVEFVAAYRAKPLPAVDLTMGSAQQVQQMHERSHFIKTGDLWLYTEGDVLPLYQPKRADLCWCGSGQKFKRCHG